METVLVSGGRGASGRWVVDRLAGDYEVVVVERAEQSSGHRDGRVLLVPAGRERVGHLRVSDGDGRFRQIGLLAQPLDPSVEVRVLVGVDRAGPHAPQGEFVAEEVLRERERAEHREREQSPDVEHLD